MMVSGDDNELAPDYAAKIMERMDGDRRIVAPRATGSIEWKK